MYHYQHVLCAVDFSPECHDVALRAVDIARKAGARLSLVHVLEAMPMAFIGGEYALPLDNRLEMTLREHAEAQMQAMVKALAFKDLEWHMLDGSIKQGVIHCAATENCDLIVVGAHGHHGGALLHGGNANSILHAAPCDVLAVHVES